MEGAIVFFAVLISVFDINAGYIEALTLTHPLNRGLEHKLYFNKRGSRMKSKNEILTIPFHPLLSTKPPTMPPKKPPTMPPTMPSTMPPTMPPTIPQIMPWARSSVKINPINLFSPTYLVRTVNFRNVGFQQMLRKIWFDIKRTLTRPIRARKRAKVDKWTTTTSGTSTPQKLFFDGTPEFPDILKSTGKPVIIPILMPPMYRVTNNRISLTDMNEMWRPSVRKGK